MTKTQKAVAAAGGNRAVAKELGLTPSTIWRWARADQFDPEHVKALCSMTDGLIRPEQIRPDIFGDK